LSLQCYVHATGLLTNANVSRLFDMSKCYCFYIPFPFHVFRYKIMAERRAELCQSKKVNSMEKIHNYIVCHTRIASGLCE